MFIINHTLLYIYETIYFHKLNNIFHILNHIFPLVAWVYKPVSARHKDIRAPGLSSEDAARARMELLMGNVSWPDGEDVQRLGPQDN